jgi:hypothetical protein
MDPGRVCACKSSTSNTPSAYTGLRAWPAGPSGSITLKDGASLQATCYSGVAATGSLSCTNGVITGTPFSCGPACTVTANGAPNGIQYVEGFGNDFSEFRLRAGDCHCTESRTNGPLICVAVLCADFGWSDSGSSTAAANTASILACRNYCATAWPGSALALVVPGSSCYCKWTTAIPWSPLSGAQVAVVSGSVPLVVPNGAVVKVVCNSGMLVETGVAQTCSNGVLVGTATACRIPTCALTNVGSTVKYTTWGKCTHTPLIV